MEGNPTRFEFVDDSTDAPASIPAAPPFRINLRANRSTEEMVIRRGNQEIRVPPLATGEFEGVSMSSPFPGSRVTMGYDYYMEMRQQLADLTAENGRLAGLNSHLMRVNKVQADSIDLLKVRYENLRDLVQRAAKL